MPGGSLSRTVAEDLFPQPVFVLDGFLEYVGAYVSIHLYFLPGRHGADPLAGVYSREHSGYA
ncbi:hypothetical protein DESC_370148 [Desulfosarcina cetonica]|nr:hypothetical protein DESC_370148 [Desulfosarcina cetonica]